MALYIALRTRTMVVAVVGLCVDPPRCHSIAMSWRGAGAIGSDSEGQLFECGVDKKYPTPLRTDTRRMSHMRWRKLFGWLISEVGGSTRLSGSVVALGGPGCCRGIERMKLDWNINLRVCSINSRSEV
jgi:hypothetical protein